MAVVDVKELKRMRKWMFAKGANAGVISPPLWGLPWKRSIPGGVHSILDYQSAAAAALVGALAGGDAAVFGTVLGASRALVSLVTDTRMSAVRVLPIAVHEAADYAWGLLAIAAPFLGGYLKRAPAAAIAHIALGVATIVSALVTDYRAETGVHWPHSPTLPERIGG